MPWTLALSAAGAFAAAALFARVGAKVGARATQTSEDAAAIRWFATWWYALAGSTAAVGGLALAGVPEAPSVVLVAVLRVVSLAALSVALWALLSHLVYLRTGRDRSHALAWAYAALGGLAVGLIAWSRPADVAVTAWTVEVVGARGTGGVLTAVLVLAFLLPPLAAGAAYVQLGARAADPERRRRARVVGGGIAVWALAHLLARASDVALWQFATRTLLGVAVAVAVWHELQAGLPQDARDERDDALRQRVRQLI